ncbi:MAG: hypothetical protein MZV63_33415 [Marinilabiliales bacterium]|nr:hypothetical protein [Marinilabiliales bacterium]
MRGARRRSSSEMSEHAAALLPGVDRGAARRTTSPRVRPLLERTLDLIAPAWRDFFPGYESHRRPAHRLLRLRHEGRRPCARCSRELRARLVPLVRAITARPPADDSCLKQHAPEAAAARLRRSR